MSDLDTSNDQLVSVGAGCVVVLNPKPRMTPTEARRHAAWLVVLAEAIDPDPEHTFKAIRRAVRNT